MAQFYADLFQVGTVATSTVTNGYGIFLQGPTIGATGTLTNYYALYQAAATVTGTLTNRWGIYIDDTSAKNYFGGNTLIGTTVDAGYKFEVNGAANATTLYENGIRVVTTANVSGTTNTIAKFTGTNTVGNSIISATNTLITNNFGTSNLFFGQSGSTRFGFAAGTITLAFSTGLPLLIGTFDSQELIFGANNFEYSRLTTGGNFLIGTTTDSGYKLAVNGTILAIGTIYSQPTSNANALYVANGSSSSYGGVIAFQRGGTQDGSLGCQAANNNIITGATNADICLLADGGGRSINLSTTNASVEWKLNSGNSTQSGSIKTGAPNTGTAAEWKLGSRVAAAVVLDATQYIEVEVGGTFYKLAIVT